MPAMKVTISAAMRARDVSRPRPEQVAEAEASEASWEGHPWAGGSDEEGDHPERAALAGAWAAVAEEAGLAGAPADTADPGDGTGSLDRPVGRAGRRYHARRRRRGSGGGGGSGGGRSAR